MFRRNTARIPTEDEVRWFADRLHERFLIATERDGVEQVPGAAAFLRALAESDEHTVAFATGGMREVAAAKLALLDAAGPAASSSASANPPRARSR